MSSISVVFYGTQNSHQLLRKLAIKRTNTSFRYSGFISFQKKHHVALKFHNFFNRCHETGLKSNLLLLLFTFVGQKGENKGSSMFFWNRSTKRQKTIEPIHKGDHGTTPLPYTATCTIVFYSNFLIVLWQLSKQIGLIF